MQYEPIDWYELPRYYDLLFAKRNRREVVFLEAMLERYAPEAEGLLLEPACGSGFLMESLSRLGYRVDGFDLSPSMVEYARERLQRKGLRAEVELGDMSDFRSRRRYDMAYCLVSSFKYLLTEAQALAHLRCVAASLRKGGIYVLGFHLTQYEDQRPDVETWEGARGRTKVECRIDSWPPDRRKRREKFRARLVVKKPSKTEAVESEWQFRTYDERQFQRLLAKVPELAHVATHSFAYRADEEIEFGGEDLDSVLILQRR